MFSEGSSELETFRHSAVLGMSCMRPAAPLRETALGLYPDSAWMTALTSDVSTPYSRAHELMIDSNSLGSLAQLPRRKVVRSFWSILMSRMKTLNRLSVGASVKWSTPSLSSYL